MEVVKELERKMNVKIAQEVERISITHSRFKEIMEKRMGE